MDIVGAMFCASEHVGVLELMAVGIKHRVSLYLDDLVICARPVATEIEASKGILASFQGASVLAVNFSKSAAAPIRCTSYLKAVSSALDCPICDLPCTYLGLPLSTKKLCKSDLQLVHDKLASKVAFWKARLLTKVSHLAYV
jgi:hypothetical protein